MEQYQELRGLNFEEGYIAVIDKPLHWTSADVVRKIKYALRRCGYRKIKVGHAGTLDPLATGVLIVCIGRATKMVDALQAEEKEYVAGIRFGATTPSYDREHTIDHTYPYRHITR
jgi:tRNA pseudouridine55 synthase